MLFFSEVDVVYEQELEDFFYINVSIRRNAPFTL